MPGAEKEASNLVEAVESLELEVAKLFEALGVSQSDTKPGSATGPILQARDRIVCVKSGINDAISHIEKKKHELKVNFGDDLL